MSLNDKQSRFVNEYLIDLNATQAAIRAGYSKKTSYSSGQRLLKNVEVISEIEKRTRSIQAEEILKVEDIMKELSSIARGEPQEVISERTNNLTGELEKNTTYKVVPENQDRLKALELLGKRYSMFTDKVEQTNKNIEINLGEFEDDY